MRVVVAFALSLLILGILLCQVTAELTSMRIRENPECLYGTGLWLESSLNDVNFSSKIALELMYDSDSIAVCTVEDFANSSRLKFQERSYFAHIENRPQPAEHRIVFIASTNNEDGQPQYLVLAEKVSRDTRFSSCRDCQAELWGAVFKQAYGQWQTVIKPHFVTEFGDLGRFHGVPNSAEFIQVGPRKPGILLKSEHWAFGITSTRMIIIAEFNGKLKVILPPTIITEDAYGAQTYWDSAIGLEYGRNSDFFDLRITRHGTTTEFDKEGIAHIESVSGVRIFEFLDGEYKLTIP